MALTTAACAGADDGGPALLDAGPAEAGVGDASLEAGPRPVCTDDTRLPCICDDGGSGTRACVDGQLADTCGDCQPYVEPVGGSLSRCKAGRFVGRFDMPEYLPTAAGACVGTLFGGPGWGGLAFTLQDTGEGIEFFQVVEAESCFEMELEPPEGEAQPGQVMAPVFAMAGEVDCDTGVFEAEIRGGYQSVGLCTSNDWYSVKGTLRAVYDPATETFTDGVIEAYEPKQLFDILGISVRAGGSGTWQATLDPDAEVPEPVDDCLEGVEFTDFEI